MTGARAFAKLGPDPRSQLCPARAASVPGHCLPLPSGGRVAWLRSWPATPGQCPRRVRCRPCGSLATWPASTRATGRRPLLSGASTSSTHTAARRGSGGVLCGLGCWPRPDQWREGRHNPVWLIDTRTVLLPTNGGIQALTGHPAGFRVPPRPWSPSLARLASHQAHSRHSLGASSPDYPR